jgi:alpha-N-arabinofuranosidase
MSEIRKDKPLDTLPLCRAGGRGYDATGTLSSTIIYLKEKSMKRNFRTGLIGFASLFALTCNGEHPGAVFRSFHYAGKDAAVAQAAGPATYANPVLSGFYPDPSICRKGNDYYLATSSFAYYPGIPIFHSTDLVHWRQLGHALNRPSQLGVDGVRLSGGVYAPTIRYNAHNDTFYLINTCVGGIGNFIIKTHDPQTNHWSEPIPLRFGGIDPDIFFDDDGQGYIVHNDEPPGPPEWNGHRAIWLRRFDVATDAVVGEKLLIVDGGTDKAQHPVWIEAPHLYKIDGYYYLMCAEGGTSTMHSEVIFRSDRVTGPYVPWAGNPILTQRDLPADRPNPITCAGHADLVQTPSGDWHAVFLACRPYEGGHYNTGRETFMLPVQWVDGYPVILPHGEAIPPAVPAPGGVAGGDGSISYRDDFRGKTLDDRWLFIRTPRSEWWSLSADGLRLQANGATVYEQANPAFIGARQQHLAFEAQTELNYQPETAKSLAGIVCFQNEKHNFVFGKTRNGAGAVCLVVDEARGGTVSRLAEIAIAKADRRRPLTLKVSAEGAHYAFEASFDGGRSWTSVVDRADGRILSTQTAGGFTGVVLGMYVTE